MKKDEEILITMPKDDVIHIGDMVEMRWVLFDGTTPAAKVKDGGDGRFLVKFRTGRYWEEDCAEPNLFHARWRKMHSSPAMQFITLMMKRMREKRKQKTPQLINRTIELAIEAGMDFHVDDFNTLKRHYSGEREYRFIIQSGNKSALTAMEKSMNRKPFWFFDTDSEDAKKIRLYKDADFLWEGLRVTVTSFQDADNLVACQQEYDHITHKTKTNRVFRISRDDLIRVAELRKRSITLITWARDRYSYPALSLSYVHIDAPDVFVCKECLGDWIEGCEYKNADALEQRCACGKSLYTSPSYETRLKALLKAESMSLNNPSLPRMLQDAMPGLANKREYLERFAVIADGLGV